MSQYLAPILAVLGPCAVLIIKAVSEKIAARINNIPDAKSRRESTAAEHDLAFAKMQEILDAVQAGQGAMLKENNTLKRRNAAQATELDSLRAELLSAKADLTSAIADAENWKRKAQKKRTTQSKT